MNKMVFVFVGFIIRKNTFPGYDKIHRNVSLFQDVIFILTIRLCEWREPNYYI